MATLLVVIVALAIVLGWAAKRYKQHDDIQLIRQQGGLVYYEYTFNEFDQQPTNPEPPAPRWLINLLGEDLFASVGGSRKRCRVSSRSVRAGIGVIASRAFAGENRSASASTRFASRCSATTTCPSWRNTPEAGRECFHSSNSTRAAYLAREREPRSR